jgi:hypothetical protein
MNVVALNRTPKNQTQDQQEAELALLAAELQNHALRGLPGVKDVLKFSHRIHETAERLATLT